MCMVGVEKCLQIKFFPQTLDQNGKLASSKKISLPFGRTDEHRHVVLSRGAKHRLQHYEVSHIEMPQGDATPFRLRQNIS
jgi:hypothetical protein